MCFWRFFWRSFSRSPLEQRTTHTHGRSRCETFLNLWEISELNLPLICPRIADPTHFNHPKNLQHPFIVAHRRRVIGKTTNPSYGKWLGRPLSYSCRHPSLTLDLSPSTFQLISRDLAHEVPERGAERQHNVPHQQQKRRKKTRRDRKHLAGLGLSCMQHFPRCPSSKARRAAGGSELLRIQPVRWVLTSYK